MKMGNEGKANPYLEVRERRHGCPYDTYVLVWDGGEKKIRVRDFEARVKFLTTMNDVLEVENIEERKYESLGWIRKKYPRIHEIANILEKLI